MAERPGSERSMLARDKVVFLLSLVPYLLEHGPTPVARIAQDFGVSPAAVREMTEFLATAGIPGESRMYLSNDLFEIDWDALEEHDEVVLTNRVVLDDAPRFSGAEVAALIAGLQYLGALPPYRDSEALGSLLAKLGAAAPEQSPGHVAVDPRAAAPLVARLADAIAQGRSVEFDYAGAEGRSMRRRVDPLRLESVDAVWYLRGWCHLREGIRVFRLDRMNGLRVLDQPVRPALATEPLDDEFYVAREGDPEVTLDVTPAALSALADYALEFAGDGADGRTRVRMRVPHFHGLKRLVLGMAADVVVIAPPAARAAVAQWAAQALADEQPGASATDDAGPAADAPRRSS